MIAKDLHNLVISDNKYNSISEIVQKYNGCYIYRGQVVTISYILEDFLKEVEYNGNQDSVIERFVNVIEQLKETDKIIGLIY